MPARRRATGASVVRTTEATGKSVRSWEAAVAAAVRASEVSDPIGVEVVRLWADWDGRALALFRATVKVAYRERLRASRS